MTKTKQEQLQAIKQVLTSSIDTCDDCGFSAIFIYKNGDDILCPNCDHAIIEDYKLSTKE